MSARADSATQQSPGRVRPLAPEPWRLADGTRLRIRPLDRTDRDRLVAMFRALSPQSRHRRYLSPKPELTPRELTYLTDIDHIQHQAFAAVRHPDGAIVGIARYAHHPTAPGVADLAVEVIDALQSQGIGTALARRTIHSARANGFARLTATTLWENRPARALLRRLGFRARASQGGEIELELQLNPPIE